VKKLLINILDSRMFLIWNCWQDMQVLPDEFVFGALQFIFTLSVDWMFVNDIFVHVGDKISGFEIAIAVQLMAMLDCCVALVFADENICMFEHTEFVLLVVALSPH